MPSTRSGGCVWIHMPRQATEACRRRYSESQIKLMEQGYRPKKRPSEHDISDKFGRNNNGAIPPTRIIPDGNGSQPGWCTGYGCGRSTLQCRHRRRRDYTGAADAIKEWLHEGFNGLIPVNVIAASNTSSNNQYLRLCREHGIAPHPARFPRALPEFVIGLCTDEDDVVLDPFAGSNMTGHITK